MSSSCSCQLGSPPSGEHFFGSPGSNPGLTLTSVLDLSEEHALKMERLMKETSRGERTGGGAGKGSGGSGCTTNVGAGETGDGDTELCSDSGVLNGCCPVSAENLGSGLAKRRKEEWQPPLKIIHD
ncbi:hypothetical protein F0562_031746 [Nyssa sinensis]|uniref:Uncharacterized protein n=1 Tax=Nyssa sinensis TaxID=561372 RepID=A0A5J5AYJ8_9ASTE|nr:hypothetical protein F0562_031746 [Nyssa sinensis]